MKARRPLVHRKWVKLWRRAEDTLIPQAHRWQLFSFLLVKATHKPLHHHCRQTGNSVQLQPGQLVTSGRQLAKKLQRPRASLQRDLAWMEGQRMIQLKDLGWGTLVTVLNWPLYQAEPVTNQPVDAQLVDAVRQDLNQQLDRHQVTAVGRLDGGKDFARRVMARVHQDGATLEQFQHIHRVKCAEWAGTEQEKYLRPSTLYAPSHWADYLNQQPSGAGEPWKPPGVGPDGRG